MVEEEGEEMGQKVSKRGKDVVKKEKKKKKKQEEKPVEEIISEMRQSAANEESDSEEADFWMPPAGERWDSDDGGDRWGSASESDRESDEANGTGEICIHFELRLSNLCLLLFRFLLCDVGSAAVTVGIYLVSSVLSP